MRDIANSCIAHASYENTENAVTWRIVARTLLKEAAGEIAGVRWQRNLYRIWAILATLAFLARMGWP